MTILKDKRPGAAEAALKVAALKPKVLAQLWKEWGPVRPPYEECISALHLDKGFSEEAAARLLKVYDETIAFAHLVPGDSAPDNEGSSGEAEEEVLEGEVAEKPKATEKPAHLSWLKPPVTQKVPLMENERVVFAHEIRPNQSFRVLVTGDVDKDMVKALKAFAQFQEMLVATAPPPQASEGESKE